ncbi:alpha amylase [Polycladomyces sp. WAk]|uniref:Alpha-amylase n=1 Tax=Polycladomyces zharkentensis TaxID=2807616 RepID=A0ABS2WKV4_9BACL|nr:alpha amylase [Polycladomyces sp. WAk]
MWMRWVLRTVVIATLAGLLWTGSTPPAQALTSTEWQKKSIYFIMTDRFSDGDPSNNNYGGFASDKSDPRKWHGGDFQGIINQLDYIKGMGFNAIWITPVTMQKSANAYHGYWTYDFYSVDGHLGSMAKLQELVQTAHSKGISVMLDVVANHTGDFQPGSYAAPPFDKHDWYHHNGDVQDWNDQWWVENGDVAGLDDLNQENPATAAELKNWIRWLVQTTVVDGLRVDTVKHVPKWFWRDFDAAANTFTIGEVYSGDPAYVADYTNYLDAVLDFPMYYTIKNVFGHDQSMYQIRDRYADDWRYQNKFTNGLFIDNHDVPRFLSDATGRPGASWDKWPQLKAALGFIFTSRGIPIVYQGTEQGFSGGNDPYNREDMVFNPNHELYKYIAKLNSIRNAHPALQDGSQEEKWVDDTFYAFQRSKNGDEVVVMINNSWNSQTRTIPNLSNLPDGTVLYNRMGTDTATVNNGAITSTLGPKEVKIFTK